MFVLGCVRSGTTLLYHMLLSSGNFAVYRTESNALNLLEPRFGDLSILRNQKRLMRVWLGSKLFERTNLDAKAIQARVFAECGNGGDFLRIVMEEMARQQAVERWADCTPEHILYLPRIKQTIPDALIIHIVRDGRDVALSTQKQGWIQPFPWHRGQDLLAAGLYWEWMVRRGREDGRKLGADYTEVRFEELLSQPRETLARLSGFLDHDLDYDRIQKVGIGSVTEPNTSFQPDSADNTFNPVGRWKSVFPAQDLAAFEELVGETLQELGYPLAAKAPGAGRRPEFRRKRALYHKYFDLKLYLKAQTPLGRVLTTRDLSWV